MFRNALAVLLAALMVLPLQAQQTPPTVQEQVGQTAKGSIIEVKMKLRKMKKVTGRLGEVTAENFEVQVAQGQNVDNVKLRFADVKSVAEKDAEQGNSPVGVGAGWCGRSHSRSVRCRIHFSQINLSKRNRSRKKSPWRLYC